MTLGIIAVTELNRQLTMLSAYVPSSTRERSRTQASLQIVGIRLKKDIRCTTLDFINAAPALVAPFSSTLCSYYQLRLFNHCSLLNYRILGLSRCAERK